MAMTGGTARLVHTGYGGGASNYPINLYVYYKVSSQNVASNSTTLLLGMYVTTPSSSHHIQWTDHGGSYLGTTSNTFQKSTGYAGGTIWLVENMSMTVPHNDDGTKDATIYWKWSVNSSWGGFVYPSGSFSISLPTIARASQPSCAATVQMGSNLTVYTNWKSTAFSHTLRYDFYGSTGTIATGVGASYSWPVPYDLAKRIPSLPSGAGTIYCDTYNGSTLVGTKTVGFTATVPDNSTTKPQITTISVSPSGDLPSEFAGLYIQRKTRVSVDLTARSDYSSISSLKTTIQGKSYSGDPVTSDLLQSPGICTISSVATDARGYASPAKETAISVIPYDIPKIVAHSDEDAIICARCTSDGTLSDEGQFLKIKVGRSYHKVESDGVQKNFCTLSYKVGSSAPVVLLSRDSDADEIETDPIPGVVESLTSSYTVQLIIEDDISTNIPPYTFGIPTASTDFHMREGGRGAAFGKYAEEDELLDVAWNQRVRKNLRIDGDLTIKDKELLDLIYPVGSIYMSVNGTAPGTLFGGTWERLKDRFLLAAGDSYSPGGTGGESSHTLTVDEMPSHSHAVTVNNGGAHSHTVGTKENQYYTSSAYKWTLVRPDGTSSDANGTIAGGGTHNHTASAGNSGGGKAHNNMPPYIAVFMWKRVL